jgi:hypothetical protein
MKGPSLIFLFVAMNSAVLGAQPLDFAPQVKEAMQELSHHHL